MAAVAETVTSGRRFPSLWKPSEGKGGVLRQQRFTLDFMRPQAREELHASPGN